MPVTPPSMPSNTTINAQLLLRAIPGRYVLLANDSPTYTVCAATDTFLHLVMKKTDEIIGRGIFDVFPDNEQGVHAYVREHLDVLLSGGPPRSIEPFRYDLPDKDIADETFERYWSVSLHPLVNNAGEVEQILLRLDEMTDFVMRERYHPTLAKIDSSEEDSQLSVLVIDSDKTRRDRIASVIGRHWQVLTASGKHDAAEVLNNVTPAVVLTSMHPDDCECAELLPYLKQYADVAIIVWMEQSESRFYNDAYTSGADDVVIGQVTERELIARIQTQLAESAYRATTHELIHSQYHQVFMQAPIAIALLDGPDLTYVFSNTLNNAGVGKQDIVGRRLRDAFPEPEVQQLIEKLEAVYATGEPYYAIETPFVSRDPGRRSYATFSYVPVRNAKGTITGVAVFGYDVTEQVEMRQAIENESQRKDVFLAMLGHELRNPLAPIAHANELLRMNVGNLDDELVIWTTDVIQRQLNQLQHHVNDLLDLARINQGRISIERAPVAVGDLIKNAVDMSRTHFGQRSQSLHISAPDNHLLVEVDASRITQVIANLLNNASKFTPTGGNVWLSVECQKTVNNSMLRIVVRDDGEGISPDFLSDVFSPFVQEDVEHNRSLGGLGLGLALTKGIIEMHGGQIRAFSEGKGRGSQFIVELPVHISTTPSAIYTHNRAQLTGKKILVVDDIPDIAEVLQRILQQLGATVHTASSGKEALEQFAHISPTYVFMDIGLPDLSGYDVARQLRQLPQGGDATLIALTGYGLADDIQKARDAGFDHHLTKPADISDLLDILCAA